MLVSYTDALWTHHAVFFPHDMWKRIKIFMKHQKASGWEAKWMPAYKLTLAGFPNISSSMSSSSLSLKTEPSLKMNLAILRHFGRWEGHMRHQHYPIVSLYPEHSNCIWTKAVVNSVAPRSPVAWVPGKYLGGHNFKVFDYFFLFPALITHEKSI